MKKPAIDPTPPPTEAFPLEEYERDLYYEISGLFNKEQIEDMVDIVSEPVLSVNNSLYGHKVRIHQGFLPLGALPVIDSEIRKMFTIANKQFFHFNITRFSTDHRYIEYRKGDFTDWHQDLNQNNNKLTMSIALSNPDEYEGGDLEFHHTEAPTRPEMGDVVIWPAYYVHRVTAVTRGVRKVLVANVAGPRFV